MADVLRAVQGLTDGRLKSKCELAIDVIDRSIALYGIERLAFSFNGGKDSTVLLHLIRAALEQYKRGEVEGAEPAPGGLCDMHTFFFHNPLEFPEIAEFVGIATAQHGMPLKILHGGFKQGLESLLGSTPIKAIILGTRKGDPNGGDQETFCPSSHGWPAFMRINPILDWSYHDVWTFLLECRLPYCGLYDGGYTSLGSTTNTHRNAALLRPDGTYAPAYLLPDARLERAGRSTLERGHSSMVSMTGGGLRAGVAVIGDEILAAKVEDLNTRFLCSELRRVGISLQRLVILPDNVSDIAAEVRSMSASYDVVLTAGGVGPTLDDRTLEAVACACDTHLTRSQELESRIHEYFGENTTEAHLKMAEVPEGSEMALIEFQTNAGTVSPFPLVRCRNVYSLPGIPSLLQEKWPKVLEDILRRNQTTTEYHTVVLRLSTDDETVVAVPLTEVARKFSDAVSFGSYPLSKQADGAGVALSLESKDVKALAAAEEELVRSIESKLVVARVADAHSLDCKRQ